MSNIRENRHESVQG